MSKTPLQPTRARSRFPGRLKAALKAANLSQQGLVRKTGISPTAISNYIRGKGLPGAEQFGRIAEALKSVAGVRWLGCEIDHNELSNEQQNNKNLIGAKQAETSTHLEENTKVQLVPGVGRVAVTTLDTDEGVTTTTWEHYNAFRVAPTVLGSDPIYIAYLTKYRPNRFPSNADKRSLGQRVEKRCLKLAEGSPIKPIETLCFYSRLSKVGITNIIKGLTYPRDSTLFAISAALGVSPYWLEFGDTSRPPVSDEPRAASNRISLDYVMKHLVDVDSLPDVRLPSHDYELWADENGELTMDLSNPDEPIVHLADILKKR